MGTSFGKGDELAKRLTEDEQEAATQAGRWPRTMQRALCPACKVTRSGFSFVKDPNDRSKGRDCRCRDCRRNGRPCTCGKGCDR